MKTSDIADDEFLSIVQEINNNENRSAHIGDMEERLSVPLKLVLSKARRLIRRGVLDGCWCGCRGSFQIPGWMYKRNG